VHADGQLEERLTHYAKPKLLIVDGLGHLPFEPDAARLLFPSSSAADISAALCW
jgi:DNA replication protein DnaC